MFLGSYNLTFSGKNRLILPKNFRKELGNENLLYLVNGIDGEIWGFNVIKWLEEAEKRLKITLADKKGRAERRTFFGNAEECQLDSQGRFIISARLIEIAALKDKIVMLGGGDHFEIWSADRFKKLSKGK